MLTELLIRNLASTKVIHGAMDAPMSGVEQTITVEESDGIFPVVRRGEAQFHFKDRNPDCGDEIFRCIETDGAHWTVIRGAEDTPTIAHAMKFSIRQVLTAGFFQRLGAGSTTELVNAVSVFDADPSGVIPSATAIVQALDSGPVYLPSGTYALQHPLNLLPGHVLMSFGNVVLRPTRDFGGDAAIEFVDGPGITRLENVTLDGSDLPAGTSVYGIFAETKRLEGELRSVQITGFPNSGMIASGTGWHLDRVTCRRNHGSGFELSMPHSPLVGCRAIENSRYGYVGANREQLIGCVSYGNKLGDLPETMR